MNKLVKLKTQSKKKQKIIINAVHKGDLTAYLKHSPTYLKHSPTGAVIPVRGEAVQRMKEGEILGIAEVQRTHERFYFRLPFLAIRWGLYQNECLRKLMEFRVPCFFNENEVPINGNTAQVGRDDICIFQEYVEALEKKTIKIKKHVQPEFI